jgi:hypothetical protein
MHGFYMHKGQSVLAVVDLKYTILSKLHTKYFNVNDLLLRKYEQDRIRNNYVQLAVQTFY